MNKFIAGLIFTVIVLLLSHVFMVGLVSFTEWENWFTVSMEFWNNGARLFYIIIQLILLCLCIGIVVEGKS